MTAATFLAHVKAAAPDSLVVRPFAAAAAAMRAPRRPQVVDPGHGDAWLEESARVRHELIASRLGSPFARAVAFLERAWAHARARRALHEACAVLAGFDAAARVRAAGIWALSAALVDGVLTPLDPRPISAARWALWAGVVVLGALGAAQPAAIAAAWTEWRARWHRGASRT